MNISLITAGLVFLLEPNIGYIDLLPDFIGLLMMYFGVRNICRCVQNGEKVTNNLKRAIIANVLRFAAVIPTMSVSSGEPSFGMIIALCFSAVEIYFYISAFSGFCDIVDNVSDFRIKTKKAFVFSAILVIAIKLLSAAPETIYLYMIDPTISGGLLYPLAPYKNALRVICAVFSIIASVVCSSVVFKSFSSLKKDKQFNQTISDILAGHTENQKSVNLKTISFFINVMIVSIWTLFPLEIDSSRMIPILLPFTCIIIASIFLTKIIFFNKKENATIAVSTALSICFSISSFLFANEHGRTAQVNLGKVFSFMVIPLITRALLLAFLIPVIIILNKKIREIIKHHTGTVWEAEYQKHNSETYKTRNSLLFSGNLLTIIWVAYSILSSATFILKYYVQNLESILMIVFLIPSVATTVYLLKIKDEAIIKYSEENEYDK